MQNIVIRTLEDLIKGSNLETQKIFTVLEQREDVVVNEAKENTINDEQSFERGEDENGSVGSIDSTVYPTNERTANKTIEVKAEITNRSRGKVFVLTELGKSFVNTIIDHACAERVTETALNGEDKIGDYLYPNLGLTKLVNQSRKSFFNTDARIIDNEELLKYDVEYELFVDEDGDPIDTLNPDEFELIWKQILRVSRKVENVNVSTKLTKPVLYWDNMSCALNDRGEMMKIVGKTTTKEERYTAQLMKAKWNISESVFLEADRKVTSNDELLLEFLTSVQGSNDNNSGDKKKGANKGKDNPRYSKFKKSKGKPQPENDAKAVALNPTAHSKGNNNSNSDNNN